MDRECKVTLTPISGGIQYLLATLSTRKEPLYADELTGEFETTIDIPAQHGTLRMYIEGVPGAKVALCVDLPGDQDDVKVIYTLQNASEEFVVSV